MKEEIVKDVLKTLRAEKINDGSVDKKQKILIKYVENLKAKNSKLEKELTTARHCVDNWKAEVKKMSAQILTYVTMGRFQKKNNNNGIFH